MGIKIKNQGFTLTEVIIAIVVVGVLASLSVPRYGIFVERMKVTEGREILQALHYGAKQYYADNGSYLDINLAALEVEIERSAHFNAWAITNTAKGADVLRASVNRITGNYRLWIDEEGDISCEDIVAGSCTSLGF